MEVIGTVGAIVGITDVATRSISALAEIRRRFNETSLMIEILTGQLVAVRTALDQIHSFIDEQLCGNDTHYELVLNLDMVIKCCKLLIGLLDDQISKLEYDGEDHITFASRVRLAMENKAVEEYSTRMDRQINALHLVLTAFKW